MNNFKEKAMKIVFLLTASFSILAVALICVFLFANGIPAIKEIGLPDFLLGTKWKPGNNLYGIFPMILGSIYVTAGAIVVGVPIGILMAIFMARFCPKKLHSFLKPMVDLLAGIPSIVYGFFGLVVIVPFVIIRHHHTPDVYPVFHLCSFPPHLTFWISDQPLLYNFYHSSGIMRPG